MFSISLCEVWEHISAGQTNDARLAIGKELDREWLSDVLANRKEMELNTGKGELDVTLYMALMEIDLIAIFIQSPRQIHETGFGNIS